ncbi:MAG TPA: hypothetical protein VK157_05440, partial [Phycisphaerales bacterium]|nr:hypothetical protein [Phycisphaerales bacterium]
SAPTDQPAAPLSNIPPASTAPLSTPREPVTAIDNEAEPARGPASLDLEQQTLFAITIEGDVKITRAGQTLTGDRLEAWARTVDHRLPDRTSLRVRTSTSTAAPTPPLSTTPSPRATETAAAVTPPTTPDVNTPRDITSATPSTAITLAFTGPLDVRRTAEPPIELQRDDLLLRVLAEGDTDAKLAAPAQGVEVAGRQLEYAATRREVAMASGEDSRARLTATRNDAQFIVAGSRVEANLATGVARVLSAGEMLQRNGDRTVAQLTWNDQAQFDVVPPAQPDGVPQARLLAANILGDVRGTLEQGTLAADTVVATFASPQIAPGEATTLKLLRMLGSAQLATIAQPDKPADSLAASTIAIDFDIAAKDLSPTRVRAEGTVHGVTAGATVQAESLDAALGLDDRGQVEARQLDATTRVVVTTSDGVLANADKLIARPRDQHAVLVGSPATLVQRANELASPTITLDGLAKTILASGTGSLRSREDAENGEVPRSVLATWTQSFAFNDTTGLAKLDGDARVEVTQGPTSRDTTSANIIEMSLAPRRDGAAPQPATGVAGSMVSPAGDRDVLWILATGTPAQVRSERYDQQNPALRTRLLSLSSPTIRADVPQQMLRASGAGQLVTSESAATPSSTRATFDPAQAGPAGQALFTWNGYADFEQAAGVATMHDGVRMIYRASADEQPAELETQLLRATFSQSQTANAAQLQSVFASGGVWARNQGREMTAATLSYDPAANIFDAQGAGNVLVDVAGTANDPPMSAKQVRWNLRTNRVEVIEPAPTVVPR